MKKQENINIEIPKGYVPEVKDGKVTLVYKGNPLYDMPESWKKLEFLSGEYITNDAEILDVDNMTNSVSLNKNVIPKGLGKPMLALIQLLQLRNRTWEVTDSKPKGYMFPVIYDLIGGCLSVKDHVYCNHPIKFSNSVVAKKFLEYHKELLWEARELL